MGDTEVSYSDFWYDLIDLKNSEILNPKTQLYVYEDFITNIYKYSADFKTSGIEGSEISGMLTEIEEKMKSVTKDASNEKLVDYINRNLSNAWTAYNADVWQHLDCWNRKGAVIMNNIETLHTIYIATMTAGIIMLVITIVLFFLFDIRHVVGRLFGFSEKKEIKKLSENTAFTSQLNQKYNQKMKGKVFTESGNLKKNQTPAQMLGLSNAPGARSEFWAKCKLCCCHTGRG